MRRKSRQQSLLGRKTLGLLCLPCSPLPSFCPLSVPRRPSPRGSTKRWAWLQLGFACRKHREIRSQEESELRHLFPLPLLLWFGSETHHGSHSSKQSPLCSAAPSQGTPQPGDDNSLPVWPAWVSHCPLFLSLTLLASSYQSHSSDNRGSLTHHTTRELLEMVFLNTVLK